MKSISRDRPGCYLGEGFRFSPQSLRVADVTINKFAARLNRLYEQKNTAPDLGAALGEYARRWWRWVLAGLQQELTQGFGFNFTSAEAQSCETQS